MPVKAIDGDECRWNAGERQQKLHCQGAEKITFTADYSGKG